jgi:hypothetical protein
MYSGGGIVNGISLGRLADSVNDGWIVGTSSGSYRLKSAGTSSAEFWRSAEGTIEFDIRDGLLPHISLSNDAGPIRMRQLEGQARLHEGKLEIKETRLSSPDGIFELSGTVSLTRELDLRLTRSPMISPLTVAARAYSITGTAAKPQVMPAATPETQARLKPESGPAESSPQRLKPH